MNILHIIGTLDRVYGGPVEVATTLALTQFKLGNHVEIATLDSRDDFLKALPGIIIHNLGPSIGKYRFSPRLIPWMIKNIRFFDAVIVHGIWQYQSFATWIVHKFIKFPYFVFAHGALDPWFKRTYPIKHIKKWLYWPWAEYNILKSATGVLFTSEEERRLASQSFCLYKAREVVINYGISSTNKNRNKQKELFLKQYPKLKDKLLLLFIGRIHPKKGCDILIEAFAQIASKYPEYSLVMAGPDQINWMRTLQKKAQELGIDDRITWTGMLEGDLKWGAFHSAECMVLPSHSENFGVVVVESLACGTPVIITNKVNIWEKIKNAEAGIICEDNLSEVINAIEMWINLDDVDKNKICLNAQRCFQNNFEIESVSKKNIEIIQNLIKK